MAFTTAKVLREIERLTSAAWPGRTLSLAFANAYPDAKKAKKSACLIKYVVHQQCFTGMQ